MNAAILKLSHCICVKCYCLHCFTIHSNVKFYSELAESEYGQMEEMTEKLKWFKYHQPSNIKNKNYFHPFTGDCELAPFTSAVVLDGSFNLFDLLFILVNFCYLN